MSLVHVIIRLARKKKTREQHPIIIALVYFTRLFGRPLCPPPALLRASQEAAAGTEESGACMGWHDDGS